MAAKKKVRRGSSKRGKSNARLIARLFPLKPLPPIRRPSKKAMRRLLREGRSHARQIIRLRARQLKHRRRNFVPGELGLLVFEGDSWFEYPWTTDIRRDLKDMGYQAESVAHHGDPIEHMIGQLPGLQALIKEQTKVAKAILLCGGGNDIVENGKDEFLKFLNPAKSATPGWNEDELVRRIDGDLQGFYLHMLGSITQFCVDKWGKPIRIVIHGYGNPVPDYRPAPTSGPWLAPVFEERGYVDSTGKADLRICTPLMAQLIGRFNDMLNGLSSAAPGLTHVRYVDLRPALSNGTNYTKYWSNELHPTRFGWREVTKVIAAAI